MLSGNEEDTYHKMVPLSENEKKFVELMKEKEMIPTWNSGFTHLR